MQDAGWTVKVAMRSQTTLSSLRPVSGGLILVYTVPDLLKALDITRSQLTAMTVVSRNNYERNIHSLGPGANFSIIKSIKRADPKDIVLAYRSDIRVISKNTNNQDFAISIRVFVDLRQTRVESDGSRPGSQILFGQLQGRFHDFSPVSRDSEPFPQQPPTASLEPIARNVAHEPSPKAKQLVWKPPKKAPESPDDTSTSSTKKDSKKKDGKAKKTRKKPPSDERSNSYAEKGKQSFVSQGLIGGFLEKLRTRMKAAEESKRQELRKAGKTTSESERLEVRRDAVTMDERDPLDYLCERVELKVNKCGDDDVDDSQEDSDDLDTEGKGNKHVQFLQSFLTYLYSRNLHQLLGRASTLRHL
ncbi:hypothetical protein KI688_007948 [Linnemannia hyalina]|uniref:Uncharacterized protein n=1 Tax=Linnemannia hyalina TaxID=64524 RepID=A0A9P8BLT6_9FUNG|nr:hypothetical protein KI688_007948 [Linnemannia hyalina]